MSGDSVPSLASMREQACRSAQRQKREQLIADKITRINEMAIGYGYWRHWAQSKKSWPCRKSKTTLK